TTNGPIMSSTSAARRPATRMCSCSDGVLIVTCMGCFAAERVAAAPSVETPDGRRVREWSRPRIRRPIKRASYGKNAGKTFGRSWSLWYKARVFFATKSVTLTLADTCDGVPAGSPGQGLDGLLVVVWGGWRLNPYRSIGL